ncbi:hypothetical protein [Microbacterium oxydans]|uniref:hypothetical protein n=1 Tax=Microbacterium oxydans TaxID=82380 RepID=UPI000F8FA054|nr:hypothetical protein [Microbacterium oxydans]AZS48806.1 hypothetical protein CVS53_03529 [Microbacterium oxydans]
MIIPAANTAAEAAAIDPTLLAFLTIFGAAGVTTVAGAGLAIWQSRRDHARWVRERRYEGLTRILALADHYARRRADGSEMMARADELHAKHASGDASAADSLHALGKDMERNLEQVGPLHDEMTDVAAALEIIGPNDVLEALNAYTDTFPSDDPEATERAKDAFVIAARKALRIKA